MQDKGIDGDSRKPLLFIRDLIDTVLMLFFLLISTMNKASVSLKETRKQFLQHFPANMVTKDSLLYVIKILGDGL